MPTTVPLADLFAADDWFALLDVSLTGIHLVRPVYAPDVAQGVGRHRYRAGAGNLR